MTATNTVTRSISTPEGVSVRLDIDMETGAVSRYMSVYRVKLKTEEARRLFLASVGVLYPSEVANFILECNARAVAKPVRSAARHSAKCRCPKCALKHVGCRRLACPVCG